MSIKLILAKIQGQLKAPKGQFNKFGGYNYRSCEDILEAVKPLAVAEDCAVMVSDEVVEVGGRIYVKATASLTGEGDIVSAVGYAREPESRKGMDDSQITGSASSYARKYALNGLFAIDDTKDADATNDHKPKTITKQQEADILALAGEVGADIDAFLGWLKINKLSDLHEDRYSNAIAALEKKRNQQ